MAHSNGESFAASTDRFRPLMLRVTICFFPFRCVTPLTAAVHFWMAGTHRVGSSLGRKNDWVPPFRQCNLEPAKENKFPNCFALRQQGGRDAQCRLRLAQFPVTEGSG